MFQIHRETLEWAGRKLTLETGRIAKAEAVRRSVWLHWCYDVPQNLSGTQQ